MATSENYNATAVPTFNHGTDGIKTAALLLDNAAKAASGGIADYKANRTAVADNLMQQVLSTYTDPKVLQEDLNTGNLFNKAQVDPNHLSSTLFDELSSRVTALNTQKTNSLAIRSTEATQDSGIASTIAANVLNTATSKASTDAAERNAAELLVKQALSRGEGDSPQAPQPFTPPAIFPVTGEEPAVVPYEPRKQPTPTPQIPKVLDKPVNTLLSTLPTTADGAPIFNTRELLNNPVFMGKVDDIVQSTGAARDIVIRALADDLQSQDTTNVANITQQLKARVDTINGTFPTANERSKSQQDLRNNLSPRERSIFDKLYPDLNKTIDIPFTAQPSPKSPDGSKIVQDPSGKYSVGTPTPSSDNKTSSLNQYNKGTVKGGYVPSNIPPLEELTLGKVQDIQNQILQNYKAAGIPIEGRSSAAGKYQVLYGTLKAAIAEVYKGQDISKIKFDADAQDKIGEYLYNQAKGSAKTMGAMWQGVSPTSPHAAAFRAAYPKGVDWQNTSWKDARRIISRFESSDDEDTGTANNNVDHAKQITVGANTEVIKLTNQVASTPTSTTMSAFNAAASVTTPVAQVVTDTVTNLGGSATDNPKVSAQINRAIAHGAKLGVTITPKQAGLLVTEAFKPLSYLATLGKSYNPESTIGTSGINDETLKTVVGTYISNKGLDQAIIERNSIDVATLRTRIDAITGLQKAIGEARALGKTELVNSLTAQLGNMLQVSQTPTAKKNPDATEAISKILTPVVKPTNPTNNEQITTAKQSIADITREIGGLQDLVKQTNSENLSAEDKVIAFENITSKAKQLGQELLAAQRVVKNTVPTQPPPPKPKLEVAVEEATRKFDEATSWFSKVSRTPNATEEVKKSARSARRAAEEDLRIAKTNASHASIKNILGLN
jgi:hypothetical protein